MTEWDWENYYNEQQSFPVEVEPTTGTFCVHKWKATLLIFSSVYDCEVCGKKKEECEKA
jgi:hypothetical protein